MSRPTPTRQVLILCGCLAGISILQRAARQQATALDIPPLALTALSTVIAVAVTRPTSSR